MTGSTPTPDRSRRSGDARARVHRAAPWLWGVFVASYFCRFFFLYAPGEIHRSADGLSYVYRLIEFLACLRAGYLFPQWAIDFRSGLGSPYFGYYQPGFFYAASMFGAVLPPVRALGATLWCFSIFGYAGMYWLVRERFGRAAGVLAATAFLLSNYSIAEVYLRGDFSEYAGMMTLPALLHWLTGWLEHERAAYWRAFALGCGVLIVLHCVAGLLGYGALALTTLCYATTVERWRRAAWAGVAMLIGAGMAAFYWVPLAFEWNLVQAERATMGPYNYTKHFVDPIGLVASTDVKNVADIHLAPTVLVLIAAATLLAVVYRGRVTREQWRFVLAMWIVLAVCAFLMGPASAGLWSVLPFLDRIQFPWRFMLVITAVTGALAGSLIVWQRLALVLAIAALLAATAPLRPVVAQQPMPATAADLAKLHFVPDAMNEWLPRGAVPFGAKGVPRHPRCKPGCHVDGLERGPGHLHFHVDAAPNTSLIIPHYFFPVGWHATLDGRPIPVESDEDDGLMLFKLPGGGDVDVRFTMTPMRRLGVLVSGLTLVGWLVALRLGLPRGVAAAPQDGPLLA